MKKQIILIDTEISGHYEYNPATALVEALGLNERHVLVFGRRNPDDAIHLVIDSEACDLTADVVVVLMSSFCNQFADANRVAKVIQGKCPHAVFCGISGAKNQFGDPFTDHITRNHALMTNPEVLTCKVRELLERSTSPAE
jgi:hypothetical protein